MLIVVRFHAGEFVLKNKKIKFRFTKTETPIYSEVLNNIFREKGGLHDNGNHDSRVYFEISDFEISGPPSRLSLLTTRFFLSLV
jgi:hypothetical protein